ncbi:MAG: hypothetical protein EOP10_11250 [Proteobacteria bacterium]|nr:MAG: hypothetical protein EOP10_11250 [Pseudomonadota bacterium]
MKSILSMALLTVFFVSCKKSASEGNQNGKKNNANSGVAPANILKDDDFRFTAGEDLKIDVNDIPLQLLDLGFRARPFVPDWENARPPTAEEEASKIFICLEKISKGKEKYRESMNGSELSFFEDRDDTECEKIEDESYTKTKIHLEKYVSRFFCEGTDFSKGIHATRIDENLFSCRTKSHYLSQSQTNSEVLVSHSFDPKERLEVAKALSSISSISGDPCSFSIEGDTWTLTSDCSVKNLNKSSALNTLVKIVHSKGSKFLRKSDTEFFSSGWIVHL